MTDSTRQKSPNPETCETTHFDIRCTQLINAEGVMNTDNAVPIAKDRKAMVALYRAMFLTRVFDERAVALQRTGRLGTFASSLGQEAVAVGVAQAMRPEDVFVPSFREQGGQLLRGVTATELLQFWGGDERGSDFAGARRDFPVCIPVGSQFPHAVGVGLSFTLRQLPRVVVVFGGDGATSKGDFYEALNMAGTWQVPAIFVIDNNQWAISTPRRRQTHARTLAQKAIAAGIPGEQVDGNDVLAVHYVASRAIERARNGAGPALIEAISYRMADHTTADDASRYRDEEQVSNNWKLDPISRLKSFLTAKHSWSADEEKALQSSCREELDVAEQQYLNLDSPTPADMFDYLFETLPPALQAQRDRLVQMRRPNSGGKS